jgi:hypothetical protein
VFSTEPTPPLLQLVIDVAVQYKLTPKCIEAASMVVNPA